jgi:hypothetical protein
MARDVRQPGTRRPRRDRRQPTEPTPSSMPFDDAIASTPCREAHVLSEYRTADGL